MARRVSAAIRLVVTSAVGVVATYAGACSGDGVVASGPRPDLSDVVYVGTATDEGLAVLLGARLVERPESTPVVLTPADGGTASGPTLFSYQIGTSANHRAPASRPRPVPNPLWDALGPERSAWAHGAPMNGPAFFLVMAAADGTPVLRVFTQETSYLPLESEWSALVAAEGPLTFTVTLAVFDEGRLTANGGPFASAPVSFAAEP